MLIDSDEEFADKFQVFIYQITGENSHFLQ